MPSLTQLEYILALHKYKNFSRAAKACHVSQPSLSTQVQKVEESLGVVLFDRSKKPILTTAKGLEVVAQAQTILKEHRKLQNIPSDTGELKGVFNLGVIPSLAPYVLPLFLESFSKSFPQVVLNIKELKTDHALSALEDDTLDAAILVTPLYEDKIIERTLFYERFFIFAAKDHPLLNKKNLSENDLEEHPVWLLEEGHCFRDQVIKVCSLGRQNQVLPNIRFESGSLETLTKLIKKGSGYTLLPELATLNLGASQKEAHLRAFKKSSPTRQVGLVRSRSFLNEEIISGLEEHILKNLPSEIKTLKPKGLKVIDI